jgi:hypothetical protein
MRDYKALKRYRSIRNFLILDSSVCRGMANFAAAPVGPDTSPRASRRAFSIISLSRSLTPASRGAADTWNLGNTGANQVSSTKKVSPSERITARTIATRATSDPGGVMLNFRQTLKLGHDFKS